MTSTATHEAQARVSFPPCPACATRSPDELYTCLECGASRARLSEPLFNQTWTVEDDEVEPVQLTLPETSVPPSLPSMRGRQSRPDVTLTVSDDELHPLVLASFRSAYRKAAQPHRASASEADPLLGLIVADDYRLISLLGRGGMGAVYKVEHLPTGTFMAMKLLSGELATQPDTVQRFREEAWATAHLSHPNTVRVIDFGESEPFVYLVMEYLDGEDLASLLRSEGRLPFPRVARLAQQICAGVAEAHELGIIHRDIKPENVFVVKSKDGEQAKVLDFGVVQDTPSGEPEKGHVVGTPYYMAPEQIRGEPVDARTDVYALGALMYKALTGCPPYAANTPLEVLEKHLHEPLTPMRERCPWLAIDADVEKLVAKALSKQPQDRHASMKDLAEDLSLCLSRMGRGRTLSNWRRSDPGQPANQSRS